MDANMDAKKEIDRLAEDFQSFQKVLTAIGDETRQHLLLIMMRSGRCEGMRVQEIAEKTNLSRPAVSHQIQILKDAGLLKIRKEGTKIYYYYAPDLDAFDRFVDVFARARDLTAMIPKREEGIL